MLALAVLHRGDIFAVAFLTLNMRHDQAAVTEKRRGLSTVERTGIARCVGYSSHQAQGGPGHP